MPSVFDTRFARSGFVRLLRHHGETVTYLPAAGGSRSLTAIIDREPPTIYDASGNAVTAEFMVRVHNDSTIGISASELDTGGDGIELLEHSSDTTPVRKTILKMVSQDGGVVVLALR